MAQSPAPHDIHSAIFHKLLEVIPDLMTVEGHGKSKVDGLMDLNLDVLSRAPNKLVIALSHYYRHPSGDMIADPDMMVAVYPSHHMAEALSYQDVFGYRTVYSADMARVNRRAKRELNQFLNTWLRNLIEQGHKIVGADHG